MALEAAVSHDVAKALGCHPNIRIWRQNSGAGYSLALVDEAKRLFQAGDIHGGLAALARCRPIYFGKEGSADWTGITTDDGKRLEIEAKKTKGKQRDSQKAFEGMIVRSRGVYKLFDSQDAAVAWAERIWPEWRFEKGKWIRNEG